MPYAHYQYASSGRSIYHINVPEHLHNIRSLLSVTYDYYEVENKGFSDKETFTGFILLQAMISIQILKNNGAFILVNIESFVLEKILRVLVCIMSCFKRVRFVRHIMTDPSQVKCSCIFEGFLGYSKQKLNCLWSYYNALKQSSEPQPLLHLHNQLSENAKRAYLQLLAKLATTLFASGKSLSQMLT